MGTQTENIEYTLKHNTWYNLSDHFKVRIFQELQLLSQRMDDVEKTMQQKINHVGGPLRW